MGNSSDHWISIRRASEILGVNPATLRQIFGWFVLLMAAVILAQEVNPAVGAAAGLTLVAAGVYLACTRTTHCPVRRLAARRHIGAAAT